MPGNPGAVVVKRRREQEDKKHAKEERERAEKREKESRELKENIKLMQKRQIEKQFEEEMLQERRKKTNKNNGFFEFERKDFLLAIYFFDLAEEWEMKKLAFENLKIEIQEKLNTIQKPSDTIESITLALINFNSIKKILLSIIKNQLSYCTNERYGSFTISEHSFQFLIDEQKVDIFSYIKKLEERKNALLSLIEKSKIDMESLLFLDHFLINTEKLIIIFML